METLGIFLFCIILLSFIKWWNTSSTITNLRQKEEEKLKNKEREKLEERKRLEELTKERERKISQERKRLREKRERKMMMIKNQRPFTPEEKKEWNQMLSEEKEQKLRKDREKKEREEEFQRLLDECELKNELTIIEDKSKYRHIPSHVQKEVWERDKGRCVKCGSRENLEFDHIIPFSKGGSNTVKNIRLLCKSCNRRKSDKIG
jgi:5-methylcytosine-specific restriction endonuclease McrA